jgi:hypothetical protein
VAVAELGVASWVLAHAFTARWPLPRLLAAAAAPLQFASVLPYALAGEIPISEDRHTLIILSPSGSVLGVAAKVIAGVAFALLILVGLLAATVLMWFAIKVSPLLAIAILAMLVLAGLLAAVGWMVNMVIYVMSLPAAFEMLVLRLPGRRWTIYSFARHPSAPPHATDAFTFASRIVLNEVPRGDWIVTAAASPRLARVYRRYGFRPVKTHSEVLVRQA